MISRQIKKRFEGQGSALPTIVCPLTGSNYLGSCSRSKFILILIEFNQVFFSSRDDISGTGNDIEIDRKAFRRASVSALPMLR